MTIELIPQLIDAGLHAYASQVASYSRPALRMRVSQVGRDADSHAVSRLGGTPHVPDEFAWPRWRDDALAFVGQINLSDLTSFKAASVLPESGMLSFFYHPEQSAWGFDPNDSGSARVYWFPNVRELRQVPLPDDIPDHGRFDAGQVSFHETLTLPPYQSREIESLGFSSDEDDQYFAFWEAFREPYGDSPDHQLLGHPNPIQDEMQLECQLVTNGIYCGGPEGYSDPRRVALEAGAGEWQLLAQIDSDDTLSMMWGDAGMLYYWIKRTDLEARDFERSWMILQCS
jgi:uncharacterized protein YwqG